MYEERNRKIKENGKATRERPLLVKMVRHMR